MKITVIGCGRWGSFLAWYLDKIGNKVTLYGRASSRNMQSFLSTRSNKLLTLPDSIELSTDINEIKDSELVVVSIDSQGLRALFEELAEKGLLTNSCCPAFVQYVKSTFPQLEKHTSCNLSPMAVLAKYV